MTYLRSFIYIPMKLEWLFKCPRMPIPSRIEKKKENYPSNLLMRDETDSLKHLWLGHDHLELYLLFFTRDHLLETKFLKRGSSLLGNSVQGKANLCKGKQNTQPLDWFWWFTKNIYLWMILKNGYKGFLKNVINPMVLPLSFPAASATSLSHDLVSLFLCFFSFDSWIGDKEGICKMGTPETSKVLSIGHVCSLISWSSIS